MEFQKIIFATVMVILLSCQVLVAAPYQSRDLSAENQEANRFPRAIREAISSLRNDAENLSRHRRYVIIQLSGKLAHNHRTGPVHKNQPRHHRFHHRHENNRHPELKKQ